MMGNSLRPIKKESVGSQVFRQLRDQVVRRVWSPGSKLPSENELSKTMGVSRVSVREALQRLASLGLLETRHGEGTFVREFSGEIFFNSLLPLLVLDETSIFDVLEYRRIIESGIAGLAAERATAEDLERLEESYRDMVRFSDDVAAFAGADLEFHLMLAQATGNPVLIKVNDVIHHILSVSMEKIVTALGMQDGLHFHRKIIDAVRAGDTRLAERLMEEHVVRTVERLRSEAVFTNA